MAHSRVRGHEVVVVTGGSQGIGREVARRFYQLGARVGLIARDVTRLAAAARELGADVATAAADVTDSAELAQAIVRLERELGPPTVLVNNAGHGHWGAVVDTDVDVFRRAIEVNYLGAVRATALVLPGMLHRRRGHIVNIASVAGRIGAPFEAAYSASKFALVGYSEALAVEVDGTGVAVSLIDPGPVATAFRAGAVDLAPGRFPRPIPPARVADAVAAAVMHDRREQFLPRWLRLAYVAKTGAPVLHRAGTRWMFAAQRRALRARLDQERGSTSTPA
ncbi:MAG: Estradiol 17-beta-dehydrogenase [Ilumatobacteraceae bacterium]|nr:Estradiol 17-beta-dehydrogenase [Ilumatobacteraceae bacterium]